jgi:hypothetical protein
MLFLATKNCKNDRTKKFPPPLLMLLLNPGFGILDPGSGMDKNLDPGFRDKLQFIML